MAKYNYLIVGAGLFGSVFAREAVKAGKKVLVVDKRCHIGGNVYTEKVEGIHVHVYGSHIFHTNNKTVWDYVNRFAVFNRLPILLWQTITENYIPCRLICTPLIKCGGW